MRKLKAILTVIWEIYFVSHFLGWLLVFYLPIKILIQNEKNWPAALTIQRFWAGWLRVVTGVKTRVYYEEPIDPTGVYVFTPNHTSFLDILTAYKYIPVYFHFMAKASLAKLPLFRVLFEKTHIPFERTSRSDSNQAFIRACKDLEKGYSILVYPEGTQHTRKGSLLPFKSGAFKMAVELQIPIVPVTCFNHLEILPHQRDLFKPRAVGGPGTAYILVGKPIEPGDDPDALLKKVYTIVQSNLNAFYEDREGYCRTLGRIGQTGV